MTTIQTETGKSLAWVTRSFLPKREDLSRGCVRVCLHAWAGVPLWPRSNWSWQSSPLLWLKRLIPGGRASEREREWERKCCHCSTISSSLHSSKRWTSMATCSIFWLTEPLLTEKNPLLSSSLLSSCCTSFLPSYIPPVPFFFPTSMFLELYSDNRRFVPVYKLKHHTTTQAVMINSPRDVMWKAVKTPCRIEVILDIDLLSSRSRTAA